jgi:hypothetical protein
LGLDFAWRIVVDRHGVDLRVTSRPGDTRFQVRLRRTEPVIERTRPQLRRAVGPKGLKVGSSQHSRHVNMTTAGRPREAPPACRQVSVVVRRPW